MSRLSQVREFWDATPCDGQSSYLLRSRLRYGKEPWLKPFLERIAARHGNILEVGCGQGTDGVTLCQLMPAGGSYTGVDMSPVSLTSARSAAEEAAVHLRVTPVFRLENAEQLSFPDNSFECVLSVGVLHHTEDTPRAISEVRRVLTPGGTAYILLYRTISPKLLVAHALRALQASVDRILRTDRALYRLALALKLGGSLGTAVYECFGGPILNSYTRSQMQDLFRNFTALHLTAHGLGLPALGFNRFVEGTGSSPWGYLWLAESRK